MWDGGKAKQFPLAWGRLAVVGAESQQGALEMVRELSLFLRSSAFSVAFAWLLFFLCWLKSTSNNG